MIREARQEDLDSILKLLKEVNYLHHLIRGDLFIEASKYSKEDLINILNSDNKKIFVAVEEEIMGYIFIEIRDIDDRLHTKIRNVYIDDLCTDSKYRGKGVATSLYEYVREYSKSIGAYNMTLHVYEGNESAKSFYLNKGMKIQYTCLEEVIDE